MLQIPRRQAWQQPMANLSTTPNFYQTSPQVNASAIGSPLESSSSGELHAKPDVFVKQSQLQGLAEVQPDSGDVADVFDPAAHNPGLGLPPGTVLPNIHHAAPTHASLPPDNGFQPHDVPHARFPAAGFSKVNREEAERLKQEGNHLRSLRQYDKAIEAYQKAIKLNPKYTDAFLQPGSNVRRGG